MSDFNTNLKRCSRGINCCHPDNVDGWLDKSEFHKNKLTNDELCYNCKKCESKHKKYLQQNSLWYILGKRTNQANIKARSKKNKQKFTPHGSGNYKNLYQVLSIRTRDANKMSRGEIRNRKMESCEISRIQSTALIICQNYKCPITGINLTDNFGELSLDHIVPDEKSGLNIIENIIFIHKTINLGKNGDYMVDALDTMLKIYLPNDSDKPLRDKRIEEIMNRIWGIQQIYPKVYSVIKEFNYKKLTEILDKRLTVNDILNLS